MGKARVDNFVFGIKNKMQLLSVCFCCECCSISRFARHVPPEMRAENLNVLQGLSVMVDGECNGCGLCESSCFLRVIHVEEGRAVIGEGCVGCGRCATACRRKAITIALDNPDMVSQVCDRLEELVDIR
jgi:UDP-glucose 4-epimerase